MIFSHTLILELPFWVYMVGYTLVGAYAAKRIAFIVAWQSKYVRAPKPSADDWCWGYFIGGIWASVWPTIALYLGFRKFFTITAWNPLTSEPRSVRIARKKEWLTAQEQRASIPEQKVEPLEPVIWQTLLKGSEEEVRDLMYRLGSDPRWEGLLGEWITTNEYYQMGFQERGEA